METIIVSKSLTLQNSNWKEEKKQKDGPRWAIVNINFVVGPIVSA